MAQTFFGLRDGEAISLSLPNACEFVLDGLRWGRCDVYFTPAYWAAQTAVARLKPSDHRLGATLHEEVAACLLGGHGIPAEVGLAAFRALCRSGLLAHGRRPSSDDIFSVLSLPHQVRGRNLRYRFARQKSQYLAPILAALGQEDPIEHNAREFRDWFLRFAGIGPKTASWITRNWLGSSEVAILDIHIWRAGLIVGLFSHSQTVARDYFVMESQLIRFASSLGVALSHLDAVIWTQMKEAGRSIFPLLHKIDALAA